MNTYSRRVKHSFSTREQSLPEEYENSCRLCLTKDSMMTDIYSDDDILPITLKLRYCIALEVNFYIVEFLFCRYIVTVSVNL